MLDFFKRKKPPSTETITEFNRDERLSRLSEEILPEQLLKDPQIPENNSSGLFARFKVGLSRTRHSLVSRIHQLFTDKTEVNTAFIEELENILLLSDVGVEATDEIISKLIKRIKQQKIMESKELMKILQDDLTDLLIPCEKPLALSSHHPFVILVVGVNGAGKTTTIGKLAKKFQSEGKSVLLAAGDTFRAAAVEQLKVWGERNQVSVITQQPGSDSASVIFDALQSAKARQIDVLIADTAGRLHTQSHLMDELKKVVRVLKKIDGEAPHEVLLVLDASIGQNALNQALQFNQAIPINGLVLTKLDGTAKGGVIFNIAKVLQSPIRFIGMGEGIEDLKTFSARLFVEALFSDSTNEAKG